MLNTICERSPSLKKEGHNISLTEIFENQSKARVGTDRLSGGTQSVATTSNVRGQCETMLPEAAEMPTESSPSLKKEGLNISITENQIEARVGTDRLSGGTQSEATTNDVRGQCETMLEAEAEMPTTESSPSLKKEGNLTAEIFENQSEARVGIDRLSGGTHSEASPQFTSNVRGQCETMLPEAAEMPTTESSPSLKKEGHNTEIFENQSEARVGTDRLSGGTQSEATTSNVRGQCETMLSEAAEMPTTESSPSLKKEGLNISLTENQSEARVGTDRLSGGTQSEATTSNVRGQCETTLPEEAEMPTTESSPSLKKEGHNISVFENQSEARGRWSGGTQSDTSNVRGQCETTLSEEAEMPTTEKDTHPDIRPLQGD